MCTKARTSTLNFGQNFCKKAKKRALASQSHLSLRSEKFVQRLHTRVASQIFAACGCILHCTLNVFYPDPEDSKMDNGSEESRSMDSLSDHASHGTSDSEEWGSSPNDDFTGDEDDSECSSEGSYTDRSDSLRSSQSRNELTDGDDTDEDQNDGSLRKTYSTDSASRGLTSDDETDTCLLSIDEHVKRRKAKELMKRKLQQQQQQQQQQDPRGLNMTDSEDSASLDTDEDDNTETDIYLSSVDGKSKNSQKSKISPKGKDETGSLKSKDSRSDDDTDTCLLSIDDHVRRRYAKWKKFRAAMQKKEPVDLACIASETGTVESGTVNSSSRETLTVVSKVEADLPPHEDRRFNHKHGEDWRIENWKKKENRTGRRSVRENRALKGVDYISAVEVASTNRDISVVEPGISKKAAREAFEKEVPDEIPVMIRDDVSSIYPPIRAPAQFLYPPKRVPYNGMILEDPVSYDEEIGDASTKGYDLSIIAASEAKKRKKKKDAQRSDIELILIAVISLSLLILVILLIVILAKNS